MVYQIGLVVFRICVAYNPGLQPRIRKSRSYPISDIQVARPGIKPRTPSWFQTLLQSYADLEAEDTPSLKS